MRRRHKKILLKFTAAMTTVAVFYCQVVHAYAMPLVSDPPPFPRDVGAAAQYVDNESGHFVEISVAGKVYKYDYVTEKLYLKQNNGSWGAGSWGYGDDVYDIAIGLERIRGWVILKSDQMTGESHGFETPIVRAPPEGTEVKIDVAALKNQLLKSEEYQHKTTLMAVVTRRVVERLVSQGSPSAEIAAIESYLQNQDMHFGSSAFVPLQGMLKHLGVDVSEEDLAVEAILAEVALGNISSATPRKDPLQISLRGLQLVAANHGKRVETTRVTLEDLRVMSKPMVVLIEGSHYVTVTETADGVVTYTDPSIGPSGESVRVSEEKFAELMKKGAEAFAPSSQLPASSLVGYALTQEVPADSAKLLSAQDAAKIKGSFIGLIFAVISVIAHIAVAVVAVAVMAVTAVVGLVGAFIGAIVTGFGAMLTGISAALHAIPIVGALVPAGGFGGLFAGGTLLSNIGAGLVTMGLGFAADAAGLNLGGINPLTLLMLPIAPMKGLLDIAIGVAMQHVDFFQEGIGAVVGAFVAGGLSGGLNFNAATAGGGTMIQAVTRSAVTAAAKQGVMELGRDHIDPNVLSVLGTVAGTVAGGGVDAVMKPGGSFWQGASDAFKDYRPKLIQDIAVTGVGIVGGKNNWDPALTAGAQAAIGALLSPAPRDDPATPNIDESQSKRMTMTDRVVQGLAAGIASWGAVKLAQEIDAGPLTENALILLSTTLASAAIQTATTPGATAADLANNIQLAVTVSLKAVVENVTSFGTAGIDRTTSYGEAIYQQRIMEVSKKIKEQGLEETLEDQLASAMQGAAIGQAAQIIEPMVRGAVELVKGITSKVMINGEKSATKRALDEQNSVIAADDGSEIILDLGDGDYTVQMEFDEDEFEAVHLLNKGRALSDAEMAFVVEQLGIEAGRLVEITPAQREQDKIEFKKFTSEVEKRLSEELGIEKARLVIGDLDQAGERLIEDPTTIKEVKTELSQKEAKTGLTKEEWRSASEILKEVVEEFHEVGVQMGVEGNKFGGFFVYFTGDVAEFFGDPLKFGQGLSDAYTAAFEQGRPGEAGLYLLQDVFRAAALVPGVALVTKSVNKGLEEAAAAGRMTKPGMETLANRFAQAWRNLLRPFEKVYEVEGKTLTLASKGDDVIIKSGTLDDMAAGFKNGVIPSKTVGKVKVTKTAEEVNERLRVDFLGDPTDFKNPYKPGTAVTERVSVDVESGYVRVWTEGAGEIKGDWIVKKSEIQGLTPEQIKDALGLKDVPTRIADVHVPGGVKLREGVVAEVPEWGSAGGKTQVELLEDIPLDAYRNERTIGEVLQ